ncbi:MAG: hypothetical protein NVS3B28_18090 [Candidatus Velthaea sp.]
MTFPRGRSSSAGSILTKRTRTDCIRDRLAHFYFWSDYTALNAAVGVAAQNFAEVDIDFVRAWTEHESQALLEKFAEVEQRLHRKLHR